MNETLILALFLAFLAGGLLGIAFFGGLWWTVRKGLASQHPAWWFFGSTVLRTGLAVAGFWFVSGGDWRRLPACLAGFIAARIGVAHLIRIKGETDAS